jgi:hypothetical protein
MVHGGVNRKMAKEIEEEKEKELEEAKHLFKEGLSKIFQATKKVSKEVVEGFREGYAEDVSKREK